MQLELGIIVSGRQKVDVGWPGIGHFDRRGRLSYVDLVKE